MLEHSGGDDDEKTARWMTLSLATWQQAHTIKKHHKVTMGRAIEIAVEQYAQRLEDLTKKEESASIQPLDRH